MTFVDHLQGNHPEQLMLEVAFGRHMISGDLAKSIVTGVSPTHVVTIQHLLGDAFGKGWSGPEGVWFRGTNRDSTKYVFHPGIQSPSNADATQGIDAVFTDDTPHSNTAWIRVACPSDPEVGIPPFDTKNDPPTGFAGIFKCQLGDIYNNTGGLAISNTYIQDPAAVLMFGLMEIARYPSSRVDWQALTTLRSSSNAPQTPDYTTLPEGVGLTARYYNSTNFTSLVQTRWDPVVQFDLSSGAPALGLTPTAFSATYQGKIRFKYSETYTMTLLHDDSGKLYINDLVTPIINQSSAGTHTATFTAVAGVYYDIRLEWINTSGSSQFQLLWQSTSQANQTVPQNSLYPANDPVNRFQCHQRFTEPTTFDDFLRQVLFTCNGAFQDIGGQLKFFIVDDQATVYNFDETNIAKNTFKFYPRYSQQELMNLPNRYVANGRDLMDRYLQPFDPQLFYEIADLQDLAGRAIDTTVNVGNTYRWQGLNNLAYYAKLKTQNWVAEFEGQPETLPVLPGDKVTLTHSIPGWTNKQFLCIEATDLGIDKDVDKRLIKLLEW
jgi:hypothetical protein